MGVNLYWKDSKQKRKATGIEDNMTLLFFVIISNFRDKIENINTKSLDYKLNITKDNISFKTTKLEVEHISTGVISTHNIMPFGIYNNSTKMWNWMSNMNEIMFDMYNKQYELLDIFGDKGEPLLKTIFSNEVKISPGDHIVIPHFIQLLNASHNLVRIEMDQKSPYIVYALIDLGIKDEIEWNDFVDGMSMFRMIPSILKEGSSSSTKKILKRVSSKSKPKSKSHKINKTIRKKYRNK
jgi:hypothetical protein